ncbi:hypothetical protein Celaphus_00008883 [Cervus elaphus hippelaphus]|uniref:Uncharacterized protein n=1 Tax=Cervus elaphus hippelaphus TaxID=46360 RepID=A0A212DIN7_CEREH|nr:hypothetical protein Celaphus_00008883 [Cervus elaphus hippelaphus]
MLQEVSWRHSRGQEVDPCHQTKLPGQGHKGLGGELSLLLALIESEITEFFSGVSLRGKVLKIMSIRFKGICHHWVLLQTCRSGVKHSMEVTTTIHGATIQARLFIVRMQQGYWEHKISKP